MCVRNPFLFSLFLFMLCAALPTQAQPTADGLVPRFDRPESGLLLEQPTHPGSFFDVLGRKAALFGYENETFEAWAYPVKILRDFRLSFEIEGYPVPIAGPEAMAHIEVRPEATTLVYAHAAFTVRQTIFAPINEPGLVMLLDVESARPLTIHAAFRPDLRLMWPAGLMTGNLVWNADMGAYSIIEETGRFAGVVGSPLAEDVSIQPYQEEPADRPTRFTLDVPMERMATHLIPIVIAGSVEGRAEAEATYERLLAEAPALYEENVAFYRDLVDGSMRITTPDERLNAAFDWAKVGIDKGLATNPMLGTGFLAGFRTSGNSERPGFAWFFGRDALWTALATTATGDYATTRTALDFLEQFQREDGKIPHEISQSAALLDWFEDYPYPWASADATPLYVIVHAGLWQATGDTEYLREHWDSIKAAYEFTKQTDTDGDGLVENTGVGHGWVEGGALYPPHQELYMQGLWIAAAEYVAALAEALGETGLAAEARQEAARTRQATEERYWLDEEGFYAFATSFEDPGQVSEGLLTESTTLSTAEIEAGNPVLIRENTALQGVPLWWHTLDSTRAQRAIDHLGEGALATDWGARILSRKSALYDPLSYHNGSVWPLFTGWTSMGAYRYGRPHVGYQALMATALLTEQDALGYVTELLSGDYNTAFGRTSHHQVWSEAMVVTPAVEGLLGLRATGGGDTLHFAPQLPADWDSVRIENAPVGDARYGLALERSEGRLRMEVSPQAEEAAQERRLVLAPAFPLDAQIRSVEVNGESVEFETVHEGDLQRAVVTAPLGPLEIVYEYDEGTEVYVRREAPLPGALNHGLRVLRSRAEDGALNLLVEGLAEETYTLHARTPHRIAPVEDVEVEQSAGKDAVLRIAFGEAENGSRYVRRALSLPLRAR